MKEQNMIDEAIASFSLGWIHNNVTESNSTVIFGGIDEDQFVGPLYDFPLINDGWWTIELT